VKAAHGGILSECLAIIEQVAGPAAVALIASALRGPDEQTECAQNLKWEYTALLRRSVGFVDGVRDPLPIFNSAKVRKVVLKLEELRDLSEKEGGRDTAMYHYVTHIWGGLREFYNFLVVLDDRIAAGGAQ